MTLHDPAATRQPRPPAPLPAPTVDLDSQIEQLERRLQIFTGQIVRRSGGLAWAMRAGLPVRLVRRQRH